MKRLKVLVSAYACSPCQGSEPGMGWGYVNAISCHHDLWVITEKHEFKADIEARLNEKPDIRDKIKFFYIPIEAHPALTKIWPPSFYWFYRKWQQKAYDLARNLHEKIGFDLIHQLNMIGYREPGYLWKLNVPFIWGPVGGTADVPLRFASVLGPREFLYHLMRNTINAYQLRYNKRVRAALARADGFVTATMDTHRSFLRVTDKDSTVIPSTAINTNHNCYDNISRYTAGQTLKLVYAGIHVSRKALPVAMRALALLPGQYAWHLDILGHGPMTASWRRLANRLSIEANCTWHGWLPNHSDAVNIMSNADVFVFPSLQEGTPTVVVEALSKGLPVICFDHCGMADIVDESCGIKIPVSTPKRVVQDFAAAIKQLAESPEEVKRLSFGAFKRAQEFSWQTRTQEMLKVYQKAIEGSQERYKSENTCLSEYFQRQHEYSYCD